MARPSSLFFGTWELDAGTSRFELDAPPQEITTRIMPDTGGLHLTVDWVDGEGKPGRLAHLLRYDVPTTVLGAEVTLRVLDERTLETEVRKAGRTVQRTRRVLQGDGTLAFTQEGWLQGGRRVTQQLCYRRRP